MKSEFSDTNIHEIKKVELNTPIIFAGFVGAGLVGPLSVGCIIDKLEMEEIGRFFSLFVHLRLVY